MAFKYPKQLRLRTRSDFKRMRKTSVKYIGALICIDVRKNNSQETRLGITVTKKFGDSPRRNRFKRLVREAFRLSYPQLCKGVDLNVRPLKNDYKASMQDVQQELLQFLSRETC